MFHLLNRKFEKVTLDIAEQFLTHNTYPYQRPIRKKNLRKITSAINTGRFLVGYIAIAKQGWNGGDRMMVNGQHQCLSVIETGKPITAVIEEYECPTPEDFADLYRQFDNHGERSLAEVAIPEAGALDLNWSKSLLNKMLAAIVFLENHHNNLPKNEKILLLKKYIREGNFINETINCVKGTEAAHILRSPVIAAMISTYRKCSSGAEIFWEEVRDGERLSAKDPSFKLRNYLLTTSIGYGRGVNANMLNASAAPKEMYAKCIVAWNAYRTDGTTSLKYFAGKETPKAV